MCISFLLPNHQVTPLSLLVSSCVFQTLFLISMKLGLKDKDHLMHQYLQMTIYILDQCCPIEI